MRGPTWLGEAVDRHGERCAHYLGLLAVGRAVMRPAAAERKEEEAEDQQCSCSEWRGLIGRIDVYSEEDPAPVFVGLLGCLDNVDMPCNLAVKGKLGFAHDYYERRLALMNPDYRSRKHAERRELVETVMVGGLNVQYSARFAAAKLIEGKDSRRGPTLLFLTARAGRDLKAVRAGAWMPENRADVVDDFRFQNVFHRAGVAFDFLVLLNEQHIGKQSFRQPMRTDKLFGFLFAAF